MLAIYTGRGVAPEVNLRERISSTPPQSSNKAEPTLALKPEETSAEVRNRRISGSKNGHVSNKNLKKKQHFVDYYLKTCKTRALSIVIF